MWRIHTCEAARCSQPPPSTFPKSQSCRWRFCLWALRPQAATGVSAVSRVGDLSAAHPLHHEPRSACSWSLGSSTIPFLEKLVLVGPAGAGDLTPGLVAGDITCPGHGGGLWPGARVWVRVLKTPWSHSQPCFPSACASCPASHTPSGSQLGTELQPWEVLGFRREHPATGCPRLSALVCVARGEEPGAALHDDDTLW